ncbi:alcohol dehydrogenase catalytic domain-containing protein [Saccharopolyspora endophytica]|uniref:Alcohol dehydrogenase catalytic domain-containing protein n=1 Tax=Saccharopolyspora endophytica TaxID=543886 RepID=A0ABS5DGQ8_9PSEU|nr:alcohol dehydrogenase catalytic domain-containing protein [Saccharopolyspora endophytica]MBQ0925476.1 alcohol dehydrogenase catalytic domain-containing protein [Saccharopolyspora endophytica]
MDHRVRRPAVKVARTLARERIEIQDVPPPHPGPGEALVRVHTVTLCGTDLHIWEDDYATELPIVQGHEIAGVVESAPPGSRFQAGDRVAVSPMRWCGTCYACGIGRVNACRSSSCLGCYEDGGLTELLPAPLGDLHPIPENLPTGLAALAEPASIAMQAVLRGRPEKGEQALVMGCGPIGLLATLHLTSLGVDVIAADTAPERSEFASRFGATSTVVVKPDHALALPAEPSLVIEATGSPAAFTTAVDAVTTAGRVVLVGISDRSVTLSMRTLPVKDIDLLGSRNSQRRIGEALELLDEHRDAATALITHRLPFDRIDEAFPLLRSRSQLVGKVAVELMTS